MSGEENDLRVNSTRSRGKKSFKQHFSVTSKLNVEVEPKVINLSEEESSDEDLKLYHEYYGEDSMLKNMKPVTAEESDQIKPATTIPASTVQATSYDFSEILKLHTDLVQARERFDNCIASYVDKDETKPNNAHIQPSLDNCSVEELLQLGETPLSDVEDQSRSSSSNSDEACTQSVEITLPSHFEDKEQRRQRNKELALTKHLNQVRNEQQKELHKVHLLCLIAHGNYINNIINSDLLYGRALSLLPMDRFPPLIVTASYILRLLKWFGKKFSQKKHKKAGRFSVAKLEEVLTNSKPCSVRDSVILFVSLLRGLGLTARVVINFTPLPLKAKRMKWTLKQAENLDVTSKQSKKTGISCEPGPSHEEPSLLMRKFVSPAPDLSTDRSNNGAIPRYCSPKAGPSSKNGKVMPKRGKSGSLSRSESVGLKSPATKSSRPRPTAKLDKTQTVISKVKSQKAQVKRNSAELDASQESSCAQVGFSKHKPHNSAGSFDSNSKSSDDEEAATKVKCGIDYWAEVFIENEDHWISVDLFSLKIDCVREIANRCTQPISYILGWKNDGSVKDVTLRYAATWVTKKYQVEHDWWEKTLLPFLSKNYELDVMEEDQLKEVFEKAPMPTSISELKNHPMYVLPRHLLKYEAIYPKDSVPLGFVKGEPVYSRYCVNVLCSREKWLQQAKSIKLDQLPYKTVKSRSKTDKFASKNLDSGYKTLELFGSWQVEDYIPPIAVDGKVPKNKYGNVELYKPSMLPSGTVHIQVPGLMKIAQKLLIDCAPAVIGWQHHNGVSHPVIDGVVVCKEYQDLLLDAWNSEVDQSEFRYTVKRKIRAKKNWLKICKSLLIKERLKKKYNFGEGELTDGESLPKLPKK